MLAEIGKVGVAVLGKVRSQRNVSLLEGAKLSEALAAAGGLLPEADAEHIQIARGTETVSVDVRLWLTGDKLPDDVLLEDRDVVNVPESPHVVTVHGYISKPGVYHFTPGDTVIEVQAKAGGYIVGQSAPQRAVLVRVVDGKQNAYIVSLTNVRANPKIRELVTVQDGDSLFVPPRSTRNIGDLVKTLFPVATIYRVFSP
jgi:protein involved in polysaccharide export with SLBB domain